MKTLCMDIRGQKERGTKLVDLINFGLIESQRYVNKPYPSRIIMTKEQLNDLDKVLRVQTTFDGEARLLITSFNAMEVEVEAR